ncbi:hypothetical protein ACFQZ0_04085 [Streptomyces erythrogriseus]
MTWFPLVALVLGPVLLVEALLARYEVMLYTAGWRTPRPTSRPACPTPAEPVPTDRLPRTSCTSTA